MFNGFHLVLSTFTALIQTGSHVPLIGAVMVTHTFIGAVMPAHTFIYCNPVVS